MQGRELGCKTLGCGAAIVGVFLCFQGMIVSTKNIARQVKAQRAAKATQAVTQNLQVVASAVAEYEAATGHLPPTTSPEAFENALVPRFLANTTVLVQSSGEPFRPNAAVSGKKRSAIKTPEAVPLLTSAPNAQGVRMVLLVSGEVRELKTGLPGAAAVTTALRTPRPAPAGTSAPAASPAPSPR